MGQGKLLMVGAGLSGAVIGRHLAEAGYDITVVDARSHIGGNCHTERDADTGSLVQIALRLTSPVEHVHSGVADSAMCRYSTSIQSWKPGGF